MKYSPNNRILNIHRCTNGSTQFLYGDLRDKEPLGRPKRRWEGNIKIDPQEMEWGHGLH
jgi:hypothetical protein